METNELPADRAEVIAPPPAIFAGGLLFGLLLQQVRPMRAMPGPLARLIGLPLLISGILLARWGFKSMREAGTPIDPREPVKQLVTTGPFAYTRNPLYSALTLVYLGITCLANAFWPLLLLVGVLTVMRNGVIAREEGYLERRFGDAYRAYMDRVPRWF